MGHEFTLRLPPSQEPKLVAVEQVFICFEQIATTTGKLIEVARGAASRSYAFAAPLRSQWPEDFVVMVDSEEWYLNFHSATAAQQLVILQALTHCLHAVGIVGKFEEL